MEKTARQLAVEKAEETGYWGLVEYYDKKGWGKPDPVWKAPVGDGVRWFVETTDRYSNPHKKIFFDNYESSKIWYNENKYKYYVQ